MSIFKRKKKEDLSCLEENKIKAFRQEIKIGLFLAVTLAIIVLFVFVVGDLGSLFKKKGYLLYTYYDSVAGLERRTVVRLAGVKVGFVQNIRLKGNQAEVELSINPEVEISRDSKATLASLGLLGEKYVEILPGEDKNMVQPGGAIAGVPSVGFDQLGVMLSSIGEEIKGTSQALRELLGGGGTRSNLSDTLLNLSTFSAELNDFFRENKDNLTRSLEKSQQTIQNFDERAETVSKDLDELIQLIKNTVEENRGNLKGNLENISELISKIEESLRLLSESLEKLNKGEGTLGKLIQDSELYEKTEETVSGIQKVIEPVSSLRLNMWLRAEYFGESEKFKGILVLGLWPAPDKFLLAQVVHDPWKDKFTYSAQGGVRWGVFAPRAGIMESEFGVGLDFYSFRDRLVFSLESFDFNRDPQPRFRIWTSLAATKSIHLLLGLDDFTLASNREFYFGMRLGF
jgi:phospholipid/cholesterol/gamma-HCH transport system substrate-binding protein